MDLSALAASVLQELRQREPGRDVTYSLQPRLLRVLLENLLGNAWKFTSKRSGAHIELFAETTDGVTHYAVRDDGVGFDMAYAGESSAEATPGAGARGARAGGAGIRDGSPLPLGPGGGLGPLAGLPDRRAAAADWCSGRGASPRRTWWSGWTGACARCGGWARWWVVEDRGIGIPEDQLERIFERFGRAVSSRSYGGLGLGLYLARRAAEAHGGRVWAEQRVGGGARFTLELPLARAAEESA